MSAPGFETVVDALVATPRGAPVVFMGSNGLETARLSRRQLVADAGTLSRRLRAMGVVRGSRVAILLPTSPELLVSLVGTWCAGGVTTLLSPFLGTKLGQDRARETLAAAAPRVLIADDETLASLRGAVPEKMATLSSSALLAGERGPPVLLPWGGDVAHIQFTSGSTGGVRGAALRHAQLLENVLVTGRRIGVTSSDVGVHWLPLFHDLGFVSSLLTLVHDLPLHLIPTEVFLGNPALWLQVLSAVKGTLSPAPAFAYELLARRVGERRLRGLDLSSWRYGIVGAEPVFSSVLEAFEARFAPFGLAKNALHPCYGLAEATLAVTVPGALETFRTEWVDGQELRAQGRAVACSKETPGALAFVGLGAPVEGVSVVVRSAEGEALADRLEGRIFVSGPSVATTYVGPGESPLEGGWLDTGDVGFRVGDELFVTGRAKDVIIRGGAKVHPHEIERVVADLLGLRRDRVAAFTSFGREKEEIAVVAEVAALDASVTDRIRGEVAREVGVSIDVLQAVASGAIPRTTSGKTIRSRCPALLENGSAP
jgi:acyl-CoA synthetase (AMP-forming)/AMP-acid ligase II